MQNKQCALTEYLPCGVGRIRPYLGLWPQAGLQSRSPSLLQGQIEAREYNVSSKVPGRVEQVLVRRGDNVAEGDLLFAITALSWMLS